MNKEDENYLKETLIKEGVKRLRNLGFTNVDKSNILTDEVYSFHFTNLLTKELGINTKIEDSINELLKSMSSKGKLK